MSMAQKRPLRVFLSYSAEDRQYVRNLRNKLRAAGFHTWFDEDQLPGTDWRRAIRNAVHTSDAVIVFLSRRLVRNRRYLFHEIGVAIRAAEKKPPGAIFIIPALIEEVTRIPRRLRRYHKVDLFSPGSYERLLAALNQVALEITRRGEHQHPKHQPGIEKPRPSSNTPLRFARKILTAMRKLLSPRVASSKQPSPQGRRAFSRKRNRHR